MVWTNAPKQLLNNLPPLRAYKPDIALNMLASGTGSDLHGPDNEAYALRQAVKGPNLSEGRFVEEVVYGEHPAGKTTLGIGLWIMVFHRKGQRRSLRNRMTRTVRRVYDYLCIMAALRISR